MRIVVLMLLVMAGFFGLSSYANAEEKVMSVNWYRQPENREALEAKLRECRENPDLQEKDKNCRNAADASVRRGSFEKVKEPEIPTF